MFNRKPKIFISYRRSTGKAVAMLINAELKLRGYSDVFIDLYGIETGEYEEVIKKEIKASDCFLLLLTSNSMERCSEPDDAVAFEIRLAQSNRCDVIPISVDGAYSNTWPDTLPSDINAIRRIQFSELATSSLFQSSLDKICKRIDRVKERGEKKPEGGEIIKGPKIGPEPTTVNWKTLGKVYFGANYLILAIPIAIIIYWLLRFNSSLSGYNARIAASLFCLLSCGVAMWSMRKVQIKSIIGIYGLVSNMIVSGAVGAVIHNYLVSHKGFGGVLNSIFYPSAIVVVMLSITALILVVTNKKTWKAKENLKRGLRSILTDVGFYILLLGVIGWIVFVKVKF